MIIDVDLSSIEDLTLMQQFKPRDPSIQRVSYDRWHEDDAALDEYAGLPPREPKSAYSATMDEMPSSTRDGYRRAMAAVLRRWTYQVLQELEPARTAWNGLGFQAAMMESTKAVHALQLAYCLHAACRACNA